VGIRTLPIRVKVDRITLQAVVEAGLILGNMGY